MESSTEGEDIDVSAERQRVLSGGADDDVMRIENLTKVVLIKFLVWINMKKYLILGNINWNYYHLALVVSKIFLSSNIADLQLTENRKAPGSRSSLCWYYAWRGRHIFTVY